MLLLTPTHWRDYELIDSGNGEKLERFGEYVLRRPEPQAVWSPSQPVKLWEQAQARYLPDGSHSGNWERKKSMPDQWYIQYRYQGMQLRFRLGLTGFKHVGIFPEQAVNWEYIYDSLKAIRGPKRVLNLFAYTGGASLAARAAGADVVHCDSIKNVLSWANANMQASQLNDIRWLLEDAFKFVKREAKRGKQYQGVILDPPAYGHGPKGEKWQLEDMVNELTASVSHILAPEPSLLVFNSYSLGFSPLVLQNLVQTHFGEPAMQRGEGGELFMPERSGRRLPMGIFFRFR
jgi:23S rRNA (cytosine1962-C5)-methyltransferase